MSLKYLTLAEAAKILGMGEKTIKKWVKERERDLLREKVMIYIDGMLLFDEDLIHIIAADIAELKVDLLKTFGEMATRQRKN